MKRVAMLLLLCGSMACVQDGANAEVEPGASNPSLSEAPGDATLRVAHAFIEDWGTLYRLDIDPADGTFRGQLEKFMRNRRVLGITPYNEVMLYRRLSQLEDSDARAAGEVAMPFNPRDDVIGEISICPLENCAEEEAMLVQERIVSMKYSRLHDSIFYFSDEPDARGELRKLSLSDGTLTTMSTIEERGYLWDVFAEHLVARVGDHFLWIDINDGSSTLLCANCQMHIIREGGLDLLVYGGKGDWQIFDTVHGDTQRLSNSGTLLHVQYLPTTNEIACTFQIDEPETRRYEVVVLDRATGEQFSLAPSNPDVSIYSVGLEHEGRYLAVTNEGVAWITPTGETHMVVQQIAEEEFINFASPDSFMPRLHYDAVAARITVIHWRFVGEYDAVTGKEMAFRQIDRLLLGYSVFGDDTQLEKWRRYDYFLTLTEDVGYDNQLDLVALERDQASQSVPLTLTRLQEPTLAAVAIYAETHARKLPSVTARNATDMLQRLLR